MKTLGIEYSFVIEVAEYESGIRVFLSRQVFKNSLLKILENSGFCYICGVIKSSIDQCS